MNFSSKLIENAVNEFARLPGIGKKTALRLVLHLLNQEEKDIEQFGEAVVKMRREIKYCRSCHNVSDDELCALCSNPARDHNTLCIVENLRDIMAIENTGQYNGVYHVLGGVISPIDGIGPENLNIHSLVEKVAEGEVREVIMAISPTIEGDTTIFYISRKLKDHKVQITSIARGIAFGGDLEYADEMTLARSIAARLPYESYFTGGNGRH